MLTTVLLPISVAWFLWQANRSSNQALAAGLRPVLLRAVSLGIHRLSPQRGLLFPDGGNVAVVSPQAHRRARARCLSSSASWRISRTCWASPPAAFILVLYELTSSTGASGCGWPASWLRRRCCFCGRVPDSRRTKRVEWRPMLEKLQRCTQPAHPRLRRYPGPDFSRRPCALPADCRGAQSRAARQLAMAGGDRWVSSECICCCLMAGERASISTCAWCRRSACCRSPSFA